MPKRVLFLTGSPGVGKTTVLLKIVEALKAQGYVVGGMISREFRTCGARVGFEVLNLKSGKRGWLAHVSQGNGPQVGRYRVNLDDLDSVGASAINDAVANAEVVVIDEVGPMELFSNRFISAVEKTIQSNKLVVGIIHWKARHKIADEIRRREDAKLFILTLENRESLADIVAQDAVKFLQGNKT